MTTLNRAYSMLDVKSVVRRSLSDNGQDLVTVTGMASTPTPDRSGDIVDPMGAVFKTPMPLLWQHDTMAPVGLVTFAKPTVDGIPFTAEIPVITEPGTLKDRIDEAIQSIKLGLVAAVSIGFRVINDAVEYIAATQGIKFLEWEWYELSLVTIPANAEATIATVKSVDHAQLLPTDGRESLLAIARSKSGQPGHRASREAQSKSSADRGVKLIAPSGEGKTMDYAAQKKQFEATRAAKDAARSTLMEKSADAGETLNADQQKEFDDLTSEIETVDGHLKRLDVMEKSALSRAKPAEGNDPAAAAAARSSAPHVISVANPLPKGIAFARYALCKAVAARDHRELSAVVKQLYPDMGQMVALADAEQTIGGIKNFMAMTKAAVPAATTTDATWARPLLAYNTYLEDFIEYLRPFSILGQFGQNGIPDLHRIPFNVHIKGQTSGGSASWVGEGQGKPITKFDYNDVYLAWYKLAAIVVATDEMMRFANPGMEAMLRNQMTQVIVAKMDSSFIDPAFAGQVGVSPASITNGVTAITPSGTTAQALRSDIARLWAYFQAANLDAMNPVYIMDSATAIRLSAMRTTLESSKQFPDLTWKGGALDGVPVIVSNYVPHTTSGGTIILVNASDIFYSDDGEVTIDASREASLLMDSAPSLSSGPGAPVGAQLVSMFQTNSMAIRAERYCNWARRRNIAVQIITGTAYA